MPPTPFPERIDPRKLFTKNGTIKGGIALDRLPRLSEYLSDGSDVSTTKAEDKVYTEANLHFTRDENNRHLVNGSVKANVYMLCQRCLKERAVALESTLNVVVLGEKQWNDELLRSLPAGLEAVRATEDELDVHALIEDELILSLPTVVYHEEQDCNKELNKLRAASAKEDVESSNKAFASLQALKNEFNKD